MSALQSTLEFFTPMICVHLSSSAVKTDSKSALFRVFRVFRGSSTPFLTLNPHLDIARPSL
jgi:hypothetical protein